MDKYYTVDRAVDIIRAVQSRRGIDQARNDIYQRAARKGTGTDDTRTN